MTLGQVSTWTSFFEGVAEADRSIGFVDPSSHAQAPGWFLRNFLILIERHHAFKTIRCVCVRERTMQRDVGASIVLTIQASGAVQGTEKPKATGWEKNDADKLQPRHVDLAPLMDPTMCAFIELIIRFLTPPPQPVIDGRGPELEADALARHAVPRPRARLVSQSASSRCRHSRMQRRARSHRILRRLLLSLLVVDTPFDRQGWGVRHVTFVDSGRVSFSNPVRQSLFEFEDCLHGGKPKAAAAAAALKRIFPSMV